MALAFRTKATHYIDVWFALQQHEPDIEFVREALRSRYQQAFFNRRQALEALDSLESAWAAEIAPTIRIPLPEFRKVRADLALWLDHFE